jgi:Zn-finger nucleic acid-binding protein
MPHLRFSDESPRPSEFVQIGDGAEENRVSANCPRCQKPLEEAQVDSYQVRLCGTCKGVLIVHADLTAILESSWRVVARNFAEKAEFHARDGWQSEAALHCPDCGQAMEKYGYMGMAAVQVDRCERCELVWLDGNELQNMVIALAQSNYRSQHSFQREQEQRITLSMGGGLPEDEQQQHDFGAMFDDGVLASQVLVQLLRLLR